MREPRGEAKASIFLIFFLAFGRNLGYVPVAPDSFGATGCPRSRVHFLNTKLFSCYLLI